MRQKPGLSRAFVAAALCMAGAALAAGETPATAPSTTAAPPVVGATATLKQGVQLRKQPSAIGAAVASAPGESFVLKASVHNGDGTWWYVASPKVIGWALEPDLVIAP